MKDMLQIETNTMQREKKTCSYPKHVMVHLAHVNMQSIVYGH